MGLNGWAFEDLKLNPMAGGSASTLTTIGAVNYDEIVYHHQWWRFLAAPFVCSGECLTPSKLLVQQCAGVESWCVSHYVSAADEPTISVMHGHAMMHMLCSRQRHMTGCTYITCGLTKQGDLQA